MGADVFRHKAKSWRREGKMDEIGLPSLVDYFGYGSEHVRDC